MRDTDNRIFIVEYVPTMDSYRIERFSDDAIVAYEDYWEAAVKDIKANYGREVEAILVKKDDGTCDYWVSDFAERRS